MQRLVRRLGTVTLLALAAANVVAAIAAQLGRWIPRYDLLPHFALLYLAAGGGAAFAGAILLRRWWRIAVCACGGLALASTAVLVGPELHGPWTAVIPARACRLKIIEINARNRATSAQMVAAWLRREDADVLVVVEASTDVERDLNLHGSPRAVFWDGILLATRWKPGDTKTGWVPIGLPGAALTYTWLDLPMFAPQPTPVIAVHPSWPIPARHAWAEDQRIIGILDRVDRKSAILVGDFNSTQFSFRQRRAEKAFGLERRDVLIPTWPDVIPFFGGRFRSPVPFLPIDHIYAGSNWRTVKVERGPRLGSDHYPLIATLAWVGPLRTGDPRTSCPDR